MKEGLKPEHQQTSEKPRKQFSELNAPQKVKAIMAIMTVPLSREGVSLSRESILRAAGVDACQLKDSERIVVEEVFNSTKDDKLRPDSPQTYGMPYEQKEEVLQELGVDIESVKKQHINSVKKELIQLFGEETANSIFPDHPSK
jgi:hypothetical protein